MQFRLAFGAQEMQIGDVKKYLRGRAKAANVVQVAISDHVPEQKDIIKPAAMLLQVLFH
ncbi:hypothetical protein D3C83_110600 [compost metagenome]